MKDFITTTAELQGNIQRTNSSLMIAQREGVNLLKITISEEEKQELQKALEVVKKIQERVMEELKWKDTQKE